LAQQGVQIVNDGIDGSVLQDRLLLTGDSPLAGNALGKLAARTLLDALAGR
ncbi:TPA: protein deglycase HchA, partial [Stenotrophomonas maltophilia]